MDKQEDQFVEVKLLDVDTPSPSGNVYPRDVIEKAVEALKTRRRGILHGEYGMPRQRPGEPRKEYEKRYISICEQNVSHVIDVSTMEVKDGVLKASGRVVGPLKDTARDLLEKGMATFAMRAIIQYKEGNTTQTGNLTVSRCDIVTFDLVSRV